MDDRGFVDLIARVVGGRQAPSVAGPPPSSSRSAVDPEQRWQATYRVRMSQEREHIQCAAWVWPTEREEANHQRVGPAVEGPEVAAYGPAKSCG